MFRFYEEYVSSNQNFSLCCIREYLGVKLRELELSHAFYLDKDDLLYVTRFAKKKKLVLVGPPHALSLEIL